jgi:hypothetical protein
MLRLGLETCAILPGWDGGMFQMSLVIFVRYFFSDQRQDDDGMVDGLIDGYDCNDF